jgi:hypothetical protein
MKKIVVVFVLILVTSCTSNTILEKPKDLIPKDTMAMLISDLFIAKSALGQKNINNNRNINYMPLVYEKYKIDSVRFISSNFYYTSKLDEYDIIYQEINKILTAKRDSIEKKKDLNPIDVMKKNR